VDEVQEALELGGGKEEASERRERNEASAKVLLELVAVRGSCRAVVEVSSYTTSLLYTVERRETT